MRDSRGHGGPPVEGEREEGATDPGPGPGGSRALSVLGSGRRSREGSRGREAGNRFAARCRWGQKPENLRQRQEVTGNDISYLMPTHRVDGWGSDNYEPRTCSFHRFISCLLSVCYTSGECWHDCWTYYLK